MKETSLVHIIKDGCVLMLHRTRKKNDINHDKWIAVGGKKEADETIEQCAVRETFEETGLIVDALDYEGRVLFEYDRNEPEMIYIYTCRNFHGELHECNEGTLAWIDEDQVLNLSLWEGDRVFLEKMLARDPETFNLVLHYDEDGNLKEVREERE
jgi:8-oxo-dGTP diphosphatase